MQHLKIVITWPQQILDPTKLACVYTLNSSRSIFLIFGSNLRRKNMEVGMWVDLGELVNRPAVMDTFVNILLYVVPIRWR
nr:stAR-related lipid transfer protein 7, mitochondrial-like [Ipomoea batatas]GMD79653.1 stAR-related lipid transfer protein 7, mitochondrial-like [Ipomoea batatas]